MKRVAKKRAEPDESGRKAVTRVRFRSFGKLAEQAAGGRPLLRRTRVAQDPVADRVVVVQEQPHAAWSFVAAAMWNAMMV